MIKLAQLLLTTNLLIISFSSHAQIKLLYSVQKSLEEIRFQVAPIKDESDTLIAEVIFSKNCTTCPKKPVYITTDTDIYDHNNQLINPVSLTKNINYNAALLNYHKDNYTALTITLSRSY